MAHTRCMLNKRRYTPTSPGNHTHPRAHTQICNAYCFSTATIIRERASMLRYTHIVLFIHLSSCQCMPTLRVPSMWSSLMQSHDILRRVRGMKILTAELPTASCYWLCISAQTLSSALRSLPPRYSLCRCTSPHAPHVYSYHLHPDDGTDKTVPKR